MKLSEAWFVRVGDCVNVNGSRKVSLFWLGSKVSGASLGLNFRLLRDTQGEK